RCKERKIEGKFNGGDITSDGGVLPLRGADRKLGLTEYISRRKKSCRHSLGDMFRQRVYAIAPDYEDLNDHEPLRNDAVFQSAMNRDAALASPSTLCRFENRTDRSMLWNISAALVDVFIESFDRAPEELILDFDSTDDAVHGQQVGRFFHGYYDRHCFLPLYVFCGGHLLAAHFFII
ncbi:MAG: transposase, partial [Desulfobacterales bacterium]|nr:transposase [Desulfobacterales bacterium]